MSGEIKTLKEYQDRYQASINRAEEYWLQRCKDYDWFKEPLRTGPKDFSELPVKWFEDAKLNITVNCLDRHANKFPNKIAILWEPNSPSEESRSLSYSQLQRDVCRFANVLKDQGVKNGDRVCFYMAMVPELLTGILACARIGAVHSVVFGGFSSKALAERINDCQAKILITNDEGFRGDKIVPLKKISDEAVAQCECIERVLVVQRSFAKLSYSAVDLIINDLLKQASNECAPEKMSGEDPLFILYTSGSTGRPKGLQHTTAGYMLWASETFKHVFQINEAQDVYWCSADIGWITGHSYLGYGPLLNGVTQVMFEGIPTYPDAGRFWNIIDKYSVTHFYTAPTAIRALEACDAKFHQQASLASLKVLGTVGEPINEDAWNWYNEKIGKKNCPIVDTWWQTETGGIMISNLAGVTPSIPCHASLALPGVVPVLVDAEGKEVLGNPAEGNLCIKRPWPGMARSIYADPERYQEVYFSTYPGLYFTGDGAKRDAKGNYRITGRVDDVVNVSGHRIGTAEVEDVINEHSKVVESAVVGIPHKIKGQALMAFIIGQGEVSSENTLLSELNKLLTQAIGPIGKLDKVVITSGLPKTRSGKIMRRILRKLAAGEGDQLGDTSTLLNPEIVDELREKI